MMKKYSDADLEAKVDQLHRNIQEWAQSKDLWGDCGFKTFAEHVGAEPGPPPVVSVLWFEGPLFNMFNGTFDDGSQDEFNTLLETLGYEYELNDHVSAHIYAREPALSAAFENYFHWRWVCGLVEPDCADVYEELYSHFSSRPDNLHRLDWRQFEILLFRIFQNQGFQAELGPGQSDGGVDIRLLQRDPLGDILTLVQAKKYAPKRKIGIEAVSSLHGISGVEGANNAMFVTTSDYLPSARRFAGRTAKRLKLKTPADVVEWCKTAAAGIVKDKSALVSASHLRNIISGLNRNRDHRVLHARTGYNMILNDFALVLKETKYAALIMSLPKVSTSTDSYGQAGYEVPALDDRAYSKLTADCVWRARRNVRDNVPSYWDGRNLYSPWDGQPAYFNLAD